MDNTAQGSTLPTANSHIGAGFGTFHTTTEAAFRGANTSGAWELAQGNGNYWAIAGPENNNTLYANTSSAAPTRGVPVTLSLFLDVSATGHDTLEYEING